MFSIKTYLFFIIFKNFRAFTMHWPPYKNWMLLHASFSMAILSKHLKDNWIVNLWVILKCMQKQGGNMAACCLKGKVWGVKFVMWCWNHQPMSWVDREPWIGIYNHYKFLFFYIAQKKLPGLLILSPPYPISRIHRLPPSWKTLWYLQNEQGQDETKIQTQNQ